MSLLAPMLFSIGRAFSPLSTSGGTLESFLSNRVFGGTILRTSIFSRQQQESRRASSMKSDFSEELGKEIVGAQLRHVTIEVSTEMTSTKKFALYAIGIFVCYFYYGILQERITRSKYGDEGEVFTCSLALVCVMCIVNAIFAKALLCTFIKQGEDHTSRYYYALSSFSYLGAMVASNMALQHVNYPTQVVGKSCKPIPMMVFGVLLGRKRYPLSKYLFVLMIVIGICLFMYKDKVSAVAKGVSSGSLLGIGEILLLISLGLDGVTGGFQERMRSDYQTKSGHMMYNTNKWSILFLVPALIATGELWHFLSFVEKYPYVISDIFLFSLLSALGQMFIFLMVSNFGALSCSIVTTTRKFFTVLGSVLIFGNVLQNRQWSGIVLVFLGLTLDSVYGKTKAEKKK